MLTPYKALLLVTTGDLKLNEILQVTKELRNLCDKADTDFQTLINVKKMV